MKNATTAHPQVATPSTIWQHVISLRFRGLQNKCAFYLQKATPNLADRGRRSSGCGKCVSVCQAICVMEMIPSDCTRDDAAECTRKHCRGYVDSEALRLFFLLVPRRQDQQDTWSKARFENSDECPECDQLAVRLDDCHATSRSALMMSVEASKALRQRPRLPRET